MAIKDDAYKKHLKEMEVDRPKDFGLNGSLSTEDYVRHWCLNNGLRLSAPQVSIQRGKRKGRETEPHCACGRPCQLYGGRGGYSVKCEECNAKNAERQRASRARTKGTR